MNTNIYEDFQIWISVPLINNECKAAGNVEPKQTELKSDYFLTEFLKNSYTIVYVPEKLHTQNMHKKCNLGTSIKHSLKKGLVAAK